MKFLIGLAMLVAIETMAVAKPSPFELRASTQNHGDQQLLYLGPAGAMLEADYFGLPRPLAGSPRVFPCSLRLQPIAQGSRFARVCD
jgi:hypothetical protein